MTQLCMSMALLIANTWAQPSGELDGRLCSISNVNANQQYINGAGHDNNVQLWNNPGNPSSQWRFHWVGETSVYTIENANAGDKYLNAAASGVNARTNVIIWDNPVYPNAQWRLHPVAPGTYTIENMNARGMYINAAGNGRGNGVNLQLYNNPHESSTQWSLRCLVEPLQKAEMGVCKVENLNAPGEYANAAGNGRSNGVNVQLWNNPQETSSMWRFHATGGIENVNAGGKYLNAAGNGVSRGVNVILWSNPQETSSQWRLWQLWGHGGSYNIENVNAGGEYLNAQGNGRDKGVNLQLWNNPYETSSQWRILDCESPVLALDAASSWNQISIMPLMGIAIFGTTNVVAGLMLYKRSKPKATDEPYQLLLA